MSTVYAPTAVIMPASITLPQDLVDQRTAASVNVPFQTLADAIAYLMQSTTVTKSFGCADVFARTSDEIAKTWDPSLYATQWSGVVDQGASALARVRFYQDRYGLRFFSANAASAVEKHVLFPLNAYTIVGATIDSAKLILVGDAGHGALPLVMPALGIVRYKYTTNVWSSLRSGAGMVDDTSVDVAAYETLHDITCSTDQNQTVEAECDYYAIACNEGNTNAIAGLSVRRIELTQTAPRYQK